jgi:glycosyltransferase involved in cell wall biosynthesis
MNILILYQFCTFGGVERAVLNRARTFRKYGQDIHTSIGYLRDYGALGSFQEYIHANDLDNSLSAFLLEEEALPDLSRYDFVFNIDTPQIFRRTRQARNLFIECHTPTFKNRQYLASLPSNIRGLIVPSRAFQDILAGEFRDLPPTFVLPNPVSEDFFDLSASANEKVYSARPLAYLARVDDELKNFSETSRLFELFAADEKIMFAVVGRGAEDPNLLSRLENKRIIGKMFLRDQIGFDATPDFVRMIKNHRGLFLSSSRGESFGLSAAEFISAGVPVLLSDITPHRELVNDDEKFLYPLGDIQAAREKILSLLDGWEEASKTMKACGQKFRGEAFIAGWQRFLDAQL